MGRGSDMVGFRRSMVVQEGVLRFNRQRSGQPLRCQRTDDHADEAGDQAGELRRHQGILRHTAAETLFSIRWTVT